MPPTFFTRKKEKLPTSLWNLNIVHLFISMFFVLFLCRLTAGRTRSYFERSCPSEFTALWVSYGFYINYLTSVASPAIKFPCFMNLQINCFTQKAENYGGLSSPSSKSSRYCIKLIFREEEEEKKTANRRKSKQVLIRGALRSRLCLHKKAQRGQSDLLIVVLIQKVHRASEPPCLTSLVIVVLNFVSRENDDKSNANIY